MGLILKKGVLKDYVASNQIQITRDEQNICLIMSNRLNNRALLTF